MKDKNISLSEAEKLVSAKYTEMVSENGITPTEKDISMLNKFFHGSLVDIIYNSKCHEMNMKLNGKDTNTEYKLGVLSEINNDIYFSLGNESYLINRSDLKDLVKDPKVEVETILEKPELWTYCYNISWEAQGFAEELYNNVVKDIYEDSDN